MSRITSLGFTNFRVFKDNAQFELAPISIFTGTNSSGKSSIFKGLMLMKHNAGDFSKLSFSGDDHKLGTFANSKCSLTENNQIEFELGIDRSHPVLSKIDTLFIERLYVSNTYDQAGVSDEGGRLTSSRVFINDENKPVLEWQDVLLWIEQKEDDLSWYFNLEFFINKLRDEIIPIIKEDRENINFRGQGGSISFSKLSDKCIKYAGWIDKLIKLVDYDFKLVDRELLTRVNNEQGVVLGSEELEELASELEKILMPKFSAFSLEPGFGLQYSATPLIDSYSDFFIQYKKLLSLEAFLYTNIKGLKLSEFLDGVLDEHKSEFFNGITVGEILKEEFVFICSEIIQPEIDYLLSDLKTGLKNINYISSSRANTQRLYTNQSQGTTFNSLLLEIGQKWPSLSSNQGRNSSPFTFIQKWVKKFGIGDELSINRIKGVATEVSILKNNKKTDLIDLGYGVTQFLPILLEVALRCDFKADKYFSYEESEKIFTNNGPLLLIEEPEANLHPKLQSLLADFFVDVAKQFEVTLLIETHSEYLIRRLQVLTAAKEVEPENSVIYYLNGHSSETGHEFITKININPEGSLTNDFGPGFIDEATNWKMELMRLKHASLQNLN